MDPSFLQQTSHILVDEVHERQVRLCPMRVNTRHAGVMWSQVETDFLMAILKQVCEQRPYLKVVRRLADGARGR